jgi:uncharacterized protein (DUF1697 family)
MALVVFMRGVNVGKHRRFQPAALARELAEFDVVNVGAAGTLVVRKAAGQAALRAELLRRLPFEAELMICPAREVLELARSAQFPDERAAKDAGRFLSVLAKRPRTPPPLPISQPAGDEWQVRIVASSGRFVLSLWRRLGRAILYPNEVVEKRFGAPATTRNWNTVSAICDVLTAN